MWDSEHSGTCILLKCSWVISCALVRNYQSLEEAWKDRLIWYMYITCTHTYTNWFCHQIAVCRPDLCSAQSCDKNKHTVGSRSSWSVGTDIKPSQKTKIIVLIGVITNSHNPIHRGFVLPCYACLPVNNWWFLS